MRKSPSERNKASQWRPDALRRQAETYLSTVQGSPPAVPFDMGALEAAARRRTTKRDFNYLASGAGAQTTMRSNRQGLDRLHIRPRVLRDVSRRSLGIELFGRRLPAPLLLAPIGALELAHREGDLLAARAAARLGVPIIISNQASVPMERCAAAMGEAPRWFQLYYSKSDELVRSLVSRAEHAGCEAIVVTVDTTLVGFRARDLDLAYLPFLFGKGIAQYTSDPVFTRLLTETNTSRGSMLSAPTADEVAAAAGSSAAAVPDDLSVTSHPSEQRHERRHVFAALRLLSALARSYPGPWLPNLFSPLPRRAVQQFVDIYSRPSLTWREIEALRGMTRLPILLKGILSGEDAAEAARRGIDGILVSNHGGRQIDGETGAIDALPEVVAAVGGRIPVLFDSGIRGGADIFKALALGAQAVCVGRPYAYGLAAAGERGVEEVVVNFVAELELTMALAGCSSIQEIDSSRLARTGTTGEA